VNRSTDSNDIESRARRRVGMKLGFYTHALVYVLVNVGLFAISSVSGRGNWHVWPLLGWGLGLAIHGLVTFIGLSGEGVRERMLEREIERLRNKP
jgi:hypothetical protein